MHKGKPYLVVLTFLTLLVGVVYYFMRNYIHPNSFLILPVFYVVTGVSHLLMMKTLSARPTQFRMYYTAATGFKVLSYLLFLFLVTFLTGGINMNFVIVFFITYLVYTVFEMVIIYPIMKKNPTSNNQHKNKK